MARKMDYRRARKFKSAEDRNAGTIDREGNYKPLPKTDSLGKRAHREMLAWSAGLKLKDRMSIPYPHSNQAISIERRGPYAPSRKRKARRGPKPA